MVCNSGISYAQHPFFYTINDENGLPSNEVYQVLQDEFGYIWIGCDAGLFKYDGFEFKQYKSVNQNGRSISGLQLDRKGRVWCRNFNGQVYRVYGDSLKLISDFNQNTSSNNFTIDDQCNAWIVCEDKLIQFNENGKEIKRYKIPNSIGKKSNITEIIFHHHNIYFSQQYTGIYTLKKDKFYKLKVLENDPLITQKSGFFIKNDQIFVISEEINGKSYLISKVENQTIRPQKKYTTKINDVLIYKINTFNKNETWICSSAGAFRDTLKTSNLDDVKGLLPGKKISYCLKDREGMYWFCTLNDGIFVIPSLDIQKYDPGNSLLSNKNVTAISQAHNGDVLIGLSSGEINLLDSKTKAISTLDIVSNKKLITTKRIINYKGKSYIAHGQLTSYDGLTFKALPFYNIRDFVIHKDTLYYVMSELVIKVAMKDVDQGDQSKMIIIRKTGGRNIALDVIHNCFYFVLNEGVYKYQNNNWIQLKHKGKSIFASSIAYKNNSLWIASISSGLMVFKNNKIDKLFSTKNGLKENEIKFITASKKYIWACGNNYLYRISHDGNEISYYSKTSGINATEIKTIEIFDQQVYLGTNKGLIVFAENFPWENKVNPKIEIKSIYQGHQFIPFTDGIRLNYKHKNVYIHLASTSFKSKSKFYYLYRIKGLDNEWIKIPVQNKSIILANLPPGNFQLEIKSINESERASKLIQIPLFIESPIWQKWWFYLLVSVISVGIIGLIFYARLRFIRKRATLQEKLLSSQLTALKAQMNPHFMFNALNSIQDLVLEKDIKNSNLYLSKFSKLMRKILDASGAEKISLQDEIEILELYLDLEKLRFGNDFTFTISCDRNIDPYDVQIPSMIIQPFIENAIKHGLLHKKGKKELSIDFQLSECITCLIKDNGVGRKHANEIKERRAENHRSFATNATEKRIELLNEYDQDNYSFEIIDLEENGESMGTLVRIKMPV